VSFVRPRHRRGVDATSGRLLELAAACAAAGLAHAAVRRIERRLPLLLARRAARGAAAPPGEVARWRSPVALAALVPKLGVWSAALLWASDRLPALMAARDDVALLLSASFMAPLVRMGERAYSALDLLEAPLLLAALWIGVGIATRLLRRQLARAGGFESGAGDTLVTLARHLLLGAGALVVLHASGFDLSSLALFGGVLGVGLGFGMQNIASNFVSGVLLAFERPIKPGDYVTLGALSGTVRRIGARSTEIRTPDNVTILVPNARFLESEVVNWSHGSPVCKLHARVGIAYGSDPARVRAALLEAARGHPKVLADPRPTVDLDDFGESALLFDLEVWTREPEDQNEILSALYYRIEASLRRHGIEIPFPQLEVRTRAQDAPPVADAVHVAPEHDGELDPAERLADPLALDALAARMRASDGVPREDRRHLFQVHPRCFVGSDATRWLVEREGLTRREAIAVGRRMVERGLFRHVLDEHGFEDGYLFYRFREDEPDRATVAA